MGCRLATRREKHSGPEGGRRSGREGRDDERVLGAEETGCAKRRVTGGGRTWRDLRGTRACARPCRVGRRWGRRKIQGLPLVRGIGPDPGRWPVAQEATAVTSQTQFCGPSLVSGLQLKLLRVPRPPVLHADMSLNRPSGSVLVFDCFVVFNTMTTP